jgi:hypothetical protein
MNTNEVLKLALDALEINNKAWKALADSGDAGFWEAEEQPFYELSEKAITALREALAKPDFWEGYVPEPVKPAQQEPVNKYCCHLCFNKSGQVLLDRMILCPECGNKRCPKATHHDLPCTKSNDVGQKGSIYNQPAQQALDKKAENARELGLDYEPAQQCKWPTCQSEEYQQALAEQIKRELVGEQPAQQEPVAFLDWYDNAHWGNEDFKDGCWRAWDAALEHTSPPAQRTWVGLTDEERKLVRNSVGYNQFVTAGEYAEHVQKATEFKLLEKNNG